MNKLILKICKSLCVTVLLLSSTLLQAQTASEVLDKMTDSIKRYKKLSISYDQIFKWSSSDRESVSKGKIDLKEMDSFRIDTEDQLIVSNGKLLWTYSPLNNQVIIDKIEKSGGAKTPKDFLTEYPSHYRSQLLETDKFEGEFLVELTPRESGSFVTSIRIWVDDTDYLARKIEYADVNGNVTIWEVTEIDLDPKFKDSIFSFNPPASADIIDMR